MNSHLALLKRVCVRVRACLRACVRGLTKLSGNLGRWSSLCPDTKVDLWGLQVCVQGEVDVETLPKVRIVRPSCGGICWTIHESSG